MLEGNTSPLANLLSDEWKALVAAGTGFTSEDTVCHIRLGYARGTAHVNATEGFNHRVH
jgi:hypothetical protein